MCGGRIRAGLSEHSGGTLSKTALALACQHGAVSGLEELCWLALRPGWSAFLHSVSFLCVSEPLPTFANAQNRSYALAVRIVLDFATGTSVMDAKRRRRVGFPGESEKFCTLACPTPGSKGTPGSVMLLLGLDHGVGHPLLLLYDIKAPNGQNSNEFKALYHYPSDVSLSTF
jgi:hypothetical protein